MGIFNQIVQLLASLSILVIFHEFGHFAFAKLFKTRVEKFYLFFNPWFSLFKYKRGDTEYGIGWLPLGGYVKISGMIDESMDKEQMKKPPQPWEFRSKPAWQRLLIMIGGVLVNFVLAGLIYIVMLFTWGEDYLPVENAKYGIMVDSVGLDIGFRNGDKVLSVCDKEVERFSQIVPELLLNDPKKVKVERNGEVKEIIIKNSHIKSIIAGKRGFINPRFPFIVDTLKKESNAYRAGVKKGDRFIKANDSSLIYYDEYTSFFRANRNKEIEITVLRNNQEHNLKVKIDSNAMIGVQLLTHPAEHFDLEHIDYGFFAAIPAGIKKGVDQVNNYLKQFKLIFNSETEAYKSVGSFVTIGNLFPKTWDWQNFWALTAFLSIILGVINILPIPALDGGHVMFVLYEMITGRKPGDKFLEYAQIVGFVILIAIMIFAIRNDFVNHIF